MGEYLNKTAMNDLEILTSLRPQLEVIDVSEWSEEEWLAYRNSGLGCSEIGTIMGVNKFDAPNILWAKKVGLYSQQIKDNRAMFMGRLLEPVLGNMWQFYNPDVPTDEELFNNFEENNVIRRLYTPKFYARNPKYPWLFGGADGLFINEHGDLSVLEIKTIASFAADQYESGIPTSYFLQVQAYMLLFDIDYCEIFIVKDGREYEVFPFHRNEEIQNAIINAGEKFWNEHVVPAIEFHEAGNYAMRDLLEPSSEEFPYQDEAYLKERFREGFEWKSVDANEEINKHVEDYVHWRGAKDLADKNMVLSKNAICRFMGEAEILNGVENYDVSWKTGAKNRTFRVVEKKN